jgi:hypothetical protein
MICSHQDPTLAPEVDEVVLVDKMRIVSMTPLEFAFRRAYASVMSGSGLERSMDDEPRPIVVTLAAGLAMLYGVVAFGAAIFALGFADLAKLFENNFLAFLLQDSIIFLNFILFVIFIIFVVFAVVGGVSAGIFLAGLAAWRRKPWARWPLIVAYFVRRGVRAPLRSAPGNAPGRGHECRGRCRAPDEGRRALVRNGRLKVEIVETSHDDMRLLMHPLDGLA